MIQQEERAIRLKVSELTAKEDVGRGIARISASDMKQIGVADGDVIEIEGKRKTGAVVVRAYPVDVGLDIIRMDGLERRNCGAGISEAVKVTLDELKTWGVERYPDNPFDYDEALDVVFKEDTTLRRSIEPIVIDRSEAEKDLLHERPIHPFEHTRRTIDMEKPPIKERLNVVVDYATAASLDHPERNEDYLIVSQENIFGVFDGLGGHEGGEKASEVAARTCSDLLLHIEPQTTKEAEDMMIAALRASNIAIGQLELTPGAATTASLVYIWQKDSEWQVTIGNVGDSQIYLQRGDSLDVIGYDKVPDSAHNYMRFWSKVGQLAQNVSTRDELADKVQKAGMTDEEAGYTAESIASDFFRQMRYRMNTALGRNPTNYEMMIATYPLQSNDRLALMTDGVTDPLTTDAIHEIVSQPKPAQNLLEHAENLGPVERKKPDDRTAIVIEIPELADWR